MPAGGNNDDIVVIGRFANDLNLYWGVLPGFSGLASFNLPLGTLGTLTTSQTGDIVITASAHKPKIVMSQMTLPQEIKILSMIDHASKYPALEQALQKAHDSGATIKFTYVDGLDPSGRHDAGNITFTTVLNSFDPGTDYTFQQGSTVNVNIYGKELGTYGPESSFDFVVAHELGHLTIDPFTHNFVKDDYDGRNPEQTYAQDIDNAIFDAIADKSAESDYSESRDIQSSVLYNGYGTQYVGTNGNNFIDDYQGQYANSEIHTGAGQDIIQSGAGTDIIYADGTGVKYISDFDSDYDFVYWNQLPTAGSANFNEINGNLYITVAGSGYAPQDDPNALVILGYDPSNWTYYITGIVAQDSTIVAPPTSAYYRSAENTQEQLQTMTDGVHTINLSTLDSPDDALRSFHGSAAETFLMDHGFVKAGDNFNEFLDNLASGTFLTAAPDNFTAQSDNSPGGLDVSFESVFQAGPPINASPSYDEAVFMSQELHGDWLASSNFILA